VEAEAEFSPGLTLTPELPHQVARDLTKSLLVSLPLFSGVLIARLDQNFRQPSCVENQGVCSCIRKAGSVSWTTLSIRCFPSADAVV
jgi:hypothetical protein